MENELLIQLPIHSPKVDYSLRGGQAFGAVIILPYTVREWVCADRFYIFCVFFVKLKNTCYSVAEKKLGKHMPLLQGTDRTVMKKGEML